MPYTINQGDIVQVTVVTEMPAIRRCLNVLHYRYIEEPTIPDGAGAILDLLQHFGNPALTLSWPGTWRELASDQAVIEEYWGQRIYPVRYAKVKMDTNQVGTLPGEPLPAVAQFAIEKRGDIAARYAVGGVRIAGLEESLEAASQLTVAGRVVADNMAQFIRSKLTTPGGVEWQPIVYRRSNPGSSVDVTESMVNGVISSQRTRIAFRGI
jgi:hypothetical protein